MAIQIPFALAVFFHDLFTALWIGGLMVIGFVLIPTIYRVMKDKMEAQLLLKKIQLRMSIFVYISIIGLMITGIMLSKQAGVGGLFYITDEYSLLLTVKHIMVFGMIAIGVFRSISMRRQQTPPDKNKQKLWMILFYVNLGLGITTLLFTGLMVGVV